MKGGELKNQGEKLPRPRGGGDRLPRTKRGKDTERLTHPAGNNRGKVTDQNY